MRNILKQSVKTFVCLSALVCFQCGNTGIFDEALTSYPRIVRSGLNEWYPFNGNLSSRIGSADGTATAGYSAGTNRGGESGKTLCTTTARLDFAAATFGANPFTISVWVRYNTRLGTN